MILTEQTRNSYSEVFELLSHIDRKDLSKIPMDLLETIKENRNTEYSPKIYFDNFDQSLSKKSKALLIWLYLTYIVENNEEKAKLTKVLYENESMRNSQLKLNDILKKENKLQESNQLIEYKVNIFQKLINKVKNFFRIG